MVISSVAEPVSAGPTQSMEHRYRPTMGERPILPNSTPKASAGEKSGDRDAPLPQERQAADVPPEPQRARTSDFVAAIIAGALPPTPQSMGELLHRIGALDIPEESQARLKDIIA